jgi:butyryl-CoA dehydrogenase
MATYMSMEHLKFCLFDVHQLSEVLKAERYADYDEEAVSMMLDSAKDWADKESHPYFREMDEQPVRYEDGKIIVHPQIGKIMKMAGENGWIGSIFDYDEGGAQLPHMVLSSMNHIFEASNNNISGYVGLTSGAANLIRTFGNKELFDTYVPKMVSGEWAGTMCLTEPQAGSSLSDITTSGKRNEDGSFNITGQKIFISGGDHEYCENFVHLTLVRIEGAPKGTKGISLLVVPKKRLDENGHLVDNDVITAGDFQKLGQRGYATTHLVFGEHDNCKGWLVGAENMGLKYMFQMMNGARIDVGLTAASTATAAYYASLQYANERPQGRKLSNSGKKDPNQEQTLIINHPDVRRMLLLQKAIVEGSLSLLMECTMYSDISETTEGKSSSEAHLLLELLTPIAKTYPSEKGIESINNGLQVLGGYGFTMDFVLQQYYRDIRIMTLYEGTTGIQSLDLLGRKVTMAEGKALLLLTQKITETIEVASNHDNLKPYANKLKEKMGDVQEVLSHLISLAMKGQYETYLADATTFMEMMSIVVVGYQWLKMAHKAQEYLVTGNNTYTNDFYESKIHTMKFYFKYEMPRVRSCKDILMNNELLTLAEVGQKAFI